MTDFSSTSQNRDAPTATGDQNVPNDRQAGVPALHRSHHIPEDPGFVDLSAQARAVPNQFRVRSYDADDQGAYDKPPLDSH